MHPLENVWNDSISPGAGAASSPASSPASSEEARSPASGLLRQVSCVRSPASSAASSPASSAASSAEARVNVPRAQLTTLMMAKVGKRLQ